MIWKLDFCVIYSVILVEVSWYETDSKILLGNQLVFTWLEFDANSRHTVTEDNSLAGQTYPNKL